MSPFDTAWGILKISLGGGMFMCEQCGERFMGQNALFQHTQLTGHQATDAGVDMSGYATTAASPQQQQPLPRTPYG